MFQLVNMRVALSVTSFIKLIHFILLNIASGTVNCFFAGLRIHLIWESVYGVVLSVTYITMTVP